MKLKKEYIIAGLIIIASVLYLVLRSDSRVNYQLPKLSALTKGEITAVEIKGTDGSVTIKKDSGNWTISPEGYKVSKGEIDRLLSEITGLSIVDLITPRDDYARYELNDDKALSVKVSTGNGTARDFLVGKTSSSSIYSYIRLKDRKGVYSVRGNLKSVFFTSKDKWRDKQVLSFKADEAAAISITKDGKTITLTKATGKDKKGWTRDGKVVDNSDDIDNQIKTMSMLNTTGYLTDEPKGEPQAVVKITTSSETQTLTIYDKRKNGYAAHSSFVKDPFLVPLYVGDMITKMQ